MARSRGTAYRERRRVRAHSDQALKPLVNDGYCLLGALIDVSTVAALRARIDSLIAQGEAHAGVELRSGTQWIRNLAGVDATIDALGADSRLRQAVGLLLGPSAVLESIRLRNPIAETAQQSLHVDAPGPISPGDDQLVQVLLFLDDVDDDNGPTRVVPGTHRDCAVPGRDYADRTRTHPREISVHCKAGDALVLSSHLWHRGSANRSRRPRRAITYAFRRQ